LNKNNIRDLPLSGKLQSDLIQFRASDSWCRCRKRNYAVSIKRLFDAVERRGDVGRRVAALVLPISNRPRVTSSCAGKVGLRQPREHTTGANLASRDNVAHNPTLYTILETPPPATLLHPIRWSPAGPTDSYSGRPDAATALVRFRGTNVMECAPRPGVTPP